MVEWSFDARDARAAREARREFVRHVRAYFGGEADAGAAELILGELIGNVARYAPGPAQVEALFDADGITIEVTDRGAGFCAPPVHAEEVSLLSESGRGLAIVSKLADTIEIECPTHDICRVRARLDVQRN